MKKKVLVLKNDRTGDLFVSLKAINRIINKHKNDKIIIYLSNINHKFNFLFPVIEKKIISMDLSIFDKFKIFFLLLTNNFDTIYILAPKNFYYYLAFIFRKIKFYGIRIRSKKSRPNSFFVKYLFKYVEIDRLNLNKRNSSYDIQKSLIEKTSEEYNLSSDSHVTHNFDYPTNFVFFHYKKALFKKLLCWDLENILTLIESLNKKYDYVLFSSELLDTEINNFFSKKYNSYDYINKKKKLINDNSVFFLKDIDGYDLFDVVKKSSKVICPEGIISHMSYFLNKDLLTLMHFDFKKPEDIKKQLISCREWFPPKNYNFCVLKKDLNKSLNKINKRIS